MGTVLPRQQRYRYVIPTFRADFSALFPSPYAFRPLVGVCSQAYTRSPSPMPLYNTFSAVEKEVSYCIPVLGDGVVLSTLFQVAPLYMVTA